MNMRSLTVILGALTSFALGACTVTSGTSSTGSGGSGTTTTGGVGGGDATTATATTTTTSATGTGGGAACDEKYTCGEAITPPDGDPAKLCDGPSGDLYDAYFNCTCKSGGACFTVCSDNACMTGAQSADCTKCIQNADMGCAKQLEACSADI